jgi:hypothetical protein
MLTSTAPRYPLGEGKGDQRDYRHDGQRQRPAPLTLEQNNTAPASPTTSVASHRTIPVTMWWLDATPGTQLGDHGDALLHHKAADVHHTCGDWIDDRPHPMSSAIVVSRTAVD